MNARMSYFGRGAAFIVRSCGVSGASDLAVALSVSTDAFVFDPDERGPGDDLRLAFEGTQRLDPDEQAAIRQLNKAMLLRHGARRLTQPTAS